MRNRADSGLGVEPVDFPIVFQWFGEVWGDLGCSWGEYYSTLEKPWPGWTGDHGWACNIALIGWVLGVGKGNKALPGSPTLSNLATSVRARPTYARFLSILRRFRRLR